MKRELIMTEADKERKRRKIEANKAKLGCFNSTTKKVNSPTGNNTTVNEGTQTTVDTVDCGIQTEPLSQNSDCACIMSCFLQPNVYLTPAVSPSFGLNLNSPTSPW